MPFKGGVKEAAKLLAAMGPMAQKRLLVEIEKKDRLMAEKLRDNLVRMEDLQFLTPAMLVGLLRDVNLEEFGLSLRTIDQTIVEKILAMVSTGIKLDIEDGLRGRPRKVSEVESAQAKILKILREKVDKGQIVINPEGDELV